MKYNLIITCEHASNHVPEAYDYLFEHCRDVLVTHRGWDPGAIEVATTLSANLGAPLFAGTATRLLIETNRSLGHHQFYSEYASILSEEEKEKLSALFYSPYRESVQSAIAEMKKPVLHFSIHSFTPIWNEQVRPLDVGLLFDPERKLESHICTQLKNLLSERLPSCQVLFNEPYQGIDDGFTTHLRTLHQDDDYAGIEIEINQKFVGTAELEMITTSLHESILHLK
jgi:predicted N-formylglutamate amidohydrolase